MKITRIFNEDSLIWFRIAVAKKTGLSPTPDYRGLEGSLISGLERSRATADASLTHR